MEKKYVVVAISAIMLMQTLFFMPVVKASTGFGPAEIFCSNHIDTQVIGTASLVNGDTIPKYGVFSLVMPYSNSVTWQVVPSEIIHARVVCQHCFNEMQRWEAIPGYEYGVTLQGTCTDCGSHDLLFYEPMPRDEFNQLSLEGAGNFNFEKVEGKAYTWITQEKIAPGGACNVNILFDGTGCYVIENFDKHWEFHLRGTTQATKDVEGFVVSGVDLRILMSFKFPLYIEIVSPVNKGEDFTIRVTYGDDQGSYDQMPAGGVNVTFNGETKVADENGYVTFTYPDTRGDYEYDLSADAGDDYLPASITLTTKNPNIPNPNSNNENNNFVSLENPLFLAIIASAIIILVGFIWKRKRGKKNKSKKSSDGW